MKQSISTRVIQVISAVIGTGFILFVIYVIMFFLLFKKTGRPLHSDSISDAIEKNVFVTEMKAIKKTSKHITIKEAWIEKGSHYKNNPTLGLFHEKVIDDYCSLHFIVDQNDSNEFMMRDYGKWQMKHFIDGERVSYVGMLGTTYGLSLNNCNVPDSVVVEIEFGSLNNLDSVGQIIFKPVSR